VKLFLLATMNGITLAALYFIVASGFTLIFGMMRVVNLAHGSLFLIGAYIGYDVASMTGYWFLALFGGAIGAALVGVAMHYFLLDRYQGQDLRQALVTIGLSIIAADLLLGALWRLDLSVRGSRSTLWKHAAASRRRLSDLPACVDRLRRRALRRPVACWCSEPASASSFAPGVDDRQMLGAARHQPEARFNAWSSPWVRHWSDWPAWLVVPHCRSHPARTRATCSRLWSSSSSGAWAAFQALRSAPCWWVGRAARDLPTFRRTPSSFRS
jgi:hypothetical protein